MYFILMPYYLVALTSVTQKDLDCVQNHKDNQKIHR
jgi:hypothetical protein